MNRIYVVLGAALVMGLSFAEGATAQVAAAGATKTAKAVQQLSEDEKIHGLIDYIAHLEGATFVRNGSKHSAVEAAEHLRSKYQKHKTSIPTAETFIENLASKSSMSGKEYTILFPDGKTVAVGKLLNQELQRLTAGVAR